MDTKRVFIAVTPPEQVLNSLSRTVNHFKKQQWGKEVKWVKPENLHLTLKFIGEVDVGIINEISSVVDSSVRGIGSFPAEISGLLLFPKPSKPRIISAGFSENRTLARLADTIDNSLIDLGIPKEKRRYKGHITLGRCKKNFPERQNVADKIKPVSFIIKEIVVFSSVLKSEGPKYNVEKRIALL